MSTSTSNKTARFGIRVRPEDLELWKEAADLEGLSLAAWLEMLAAQRIQQVRAMLSAQNNRTTKKVSKSK